MLITNLLFVLVVSVTNFAGNMPGGTPKQNSPGVCGPFLEIVTLFMTKICNIPYPIHDLTMNSKPYL